MGFLSGCGTVFKITPNGNLTTLYNFCAQSGCVDGSWPEAGLVRAIDGDLYGTTEEGGANSYGTVFKITPKGSRTTLYSFCANANCSDGSTPTAALYQGTDGDLYGTTNFGGVVFNCCGTIFKTTTSGALTTLHTFCTQSNDPPFGCPDGANPFAGFIQASDGNMYGTTTGGGTNCVASGGCGTAFEITPSGFLTMLYSFCNVTNCPDGNFPFATLLQATAGGLYGTTSSGGAANGTVFSLSLGLAPFVMILPASGKLGAAVKILGTNLTGSTSVTFNGVAATFTVARPSEITTTVPVGATTGTVQVVTPDGTLSSNVVFRIP